MSLFCFHKTSNFEIKRCDKWVRFMTTHSTINKKETKLMKRFFSSNIIFIVLLIILGSQANNILFIKQEFNEFEAEIDAKISHLRDIIDRIQKGENLDISKELGTGVDEKEKEWFKVIEQVINQDERWERIK
ncbi:hypothetical protein T552_02068 [Pneumocystis carinii B80]|uniref:Uncharacterized protein n=1 Tax=Pneumocystis carinii (strain B80) TaxID=1408658 RepID=A0A0W4ZGZ3_PNEC8|nr:hypothetical protein T552_02068 [Pneumocystis carinii B80]KTW27626.1 hypothetical protein T552_02068 [Pneumocystis carinii B80]